MLSDEGLKFCENGQWNGNEKAENAAVSVVICSAKVQVKIPPCP